MRIQPVLLILLALASVWTEAQTRAQPDTNPEAQSEATAEQILAWVENLGAGSYAKRDLATKQLVAVGHPAIEPLMTAIAEQGLEVTTRGVYVLQQLAVSGDEKTEEAARQSLLQIAAARITASARHASDALQKLDALRQERALKELERLGALVDREHFEIALRIGAVFRVEINEEWTGGVKGLRWLRYLRDVEQITFIGEQVTDEWLKYLEDMPRVFVLKIKRAKITDQGLASLPKIERLQFLKLLYLPVGDGSIPHLARCKRVMSIYIFGSKMTAAGERDLRDAMAAKIDRRKGAFLGISASASDNIMWEIEGVTKGSSADRAGLLPGDIFVTYDGKPVGDFSTLQSLIAQNDVGETVTVRVRRGGEVIERQVTLGEWD